MRPTFAALVAALTLAAGQARAEYPRGPDVDRRENPTWGPREVCEAMVKAETDRQYDDLLAHTSAYARARAGLIEKLALRLARRRLANARCLEVVPTDEGHAQVTMRSQSGELSSMPFLKERGVWRFDQQRWEELRHDGRAARP